MPVDFRFVPTSGSLSGGSFEKQTEQAFNELGAHMDATGETAGQALAVANQALSTANAAISTSNDAVTIAQNAVAEVATYTERIGHAENTANTARSMAGEACAVSEEAKTIALETQNAVTTAQQTADQAVLDAAQASQNANAAMNIADSANATANKALGMFDIPDQPIDADAYTGPDKLYITDTGSANFPIAAPFFFSTELSGDSSAVTQTVWSVDGEVHRRTGSIVIPDDDSPLRIIWNNWEKNGGGGGIDLLDIKWSTTGLIDSGFIDISVDNGLLLRSAYPQAWAKIQRALDTGLPSVVDDTTWTAERDTNGGLCGRFSTGDGSTTFRVPLLQKRVSLGAPDAGVVQGDFLPDQLQGFDLEFGYGAGTDAGSTATWVAGSCGKNTFHAMYEGLNAKIVSDGVNGSPRLGSLTHGPLIIYTPMLKMYGAVTETGEADIAELIQQTGARPDADTVRRMIGEELEIGTKSYLQEIGVVCMRTDWMEDTVTTPDGAVWLKCNGQAHDQAAYPDYVQQTPSSVSLLPLLSSNTSSSFFRASASSEYGPLYASWRAFDGSTTGWFATASRFIGTGTVLTGNEFLQIELRDYLAVKGYGIAPRTVPSNYPITTPNSWALLGSYDGTNWETIDTQTDQNADLWLAFATGVPKVFSLPTKVEYPLYRLHITAINSDGTARYCDIGEFQLYNNNTYLPDIVLPGVNAYVRVK